MASKEKNSGKKSLKEAARRRRELEQLRRRADSEWCEARQSDIHGSGVFATKRIPEGARIIEYVGEKISKKESERRAWRQFDRSKNHGEAAVYIFTLSKRWDLDGSVEWNTARLINHSCEPNCEAFVEKKRIFIYALRDIGVGEELTFDYGFSLECYEDHPCLCGTDSCVGYIVSRDSWPELRGLLEDRAMPSDGPEEGVPEEVREELLAASGTDG